MLISWNYRFKCCKCSVHSNTSIHHFTSSLTRWTLRQNWGSDVMDGVDCMSSSDLHVWLQVYHIPGCAEWQIEVTQNWNGNAIPESLKLLYTRYKKQIAQGLVVDSYYASWQHQNPLALLPSDQVALFEGTLLHFSFLQTTSEDSIGCSHPAHVERYNQTSRSWLRGHLVLEKWPNSGNPQKVNESVGHIPMKNN